ncbi:hypothetical protein AC579_5554 [Pseudocercospora musae]|uniref:FAR-17a/AIG1-like protein n=1 Tax=Pseudocercospora musae TaxID=113226 RepID=A0A139I9H2_9PEZI|nr:hypothetical protein AC579_5554 [Pseudocercospora musae]
MANLIRALRKSYEEITTAEYVLCLNSSWILPTSALFAWRLLASVYAFTVLFFHIGWRCTHDACEAARQSFSYFTVLGYWGLAFYFAFAAAHTATYRWKGRPWLLDWPSCMRWLHSVFYASVTVFPYVVTAVYWGVLSGEAFISTFSTWSNISQHALNSVLAFSEIILTGSKPHPWINAAALVVLLACYLGLAYLTYATEGIYVYSFLDLNANSSGIVAAYCIGILVGTILVFVIVRYLQWLRMWIVETKLHRWQPGPSQDSQHPKTIDTEMQEPKILCKTSAP